jgi:hypothetical protein
MGTVRESTQLTWAWAQQRIWSLTANRLKRRIDQARLAALALGIATAVLAVAAHQVGGLSVLAGQVLSAVAAVTAGAATLVQRRVSRGQIRDWTRARSASEGLKTEIYSYLGGGAAYTGSDPDQRLGEKTGGIVEAVGDLQRHTLGIVPDTKPIPWSTTSIPTSPCGSMTRSTSITRRRPRYTTSGCAASVGRVTCWA